MEKLIIGKRNGSAIFGFSGLLIAEIDSIIGRFSHAQSVYAKLKSCTADYQVYAGTTNADPEVKEQKRLHKVRGVDYLWCQKHIEALCYSPDVVEATQSKQLWAVFLRYGLKIHREGYAEESANLDLLLKELYADANRAAVDATRTRLWIDRLHTSNVNFNNLMKKRASKQKTSDAGKAKDAQASMVKYINMMIDLLSILEETPQDAVVTAKLQLIAGLITQFNTVTRSDRTRRANATTEKAADEIIK